MKKSIGLSIVAALAMGSGALANPLLQFDLNGFTVTASGTFGTTFTGSLNITRGNGILNDLVRLPNGIGGTSTSLGTGGTSLDSFNGVINFTNGTVSGGNLEIRNNLGQSYAASIAANSGGIAAFIGGGFTVQALTGNGIFSSANWGTVSLADWFNGGKGGLPGSFLQFRLDPSRTASTSDMDLFVDVVPIPAAAWTGLITLGGAFAVRRLRHR
jgi:hypothetical protein